MLHKKKCKHCKKTFSAQKHIRKFCSLKCFGAHNRSTAYAPTLVKCLQCGTKLTGASKKFCSRSCAATFNNTGKPSKNRKHAPKSAAPPTCSSCGCRLESYVRLRCAKCSKLCKPTRDDTRPVKSRAYHLTNVCSCGKRCSGSTCMDCYRTHRKISVSVDTPHSLKSPKPYKGFRVYGPRVENTGRWSVSLVNPTTKKQFTMSLARYVMSVGLGRRIARSMHVDHIDMNPLNDVWSNLQLLKVSTNITKGHTGGVHAAKILSFTCPVCLTESTRKPSTAGVETSIRFCSRKCANIFSSKSSSYKKRKVVAQAKRINNIISGTATRNLLKELPVGERILFKTKGMRRIHNFTKLKGVLIL